MTHADFSVHIPFIFHSSLWMPAQSLSRSGAVSAQGEAVIAQQIAFWSRFRD